VELEKDMPLVYDETGVGWAADWTPARFGKFLCHRIGIAQGTPRLSTIIPKYLLAWAQLPLTIRPVMLKQSVYLRVPSDIAELIDMNPNAQVTLNLEEQEDEFLLTYSVRKQPTTAEPDLLHQTAATAQQPTPISRVKLP
jgi:hypothetical protein